MFELNYKEVRSLQESYGLTSQEVKVIIGHYETYYSDPKIYKIDVGICSSNKNLHRRDSRSGEAYFSDLIKGWIKEDLFIKFLSNNGIKIKTAGHDKGRIVKNRGVKADADFVIEISGKPRKIQYKHTKGLGSNGLRIKKSELDNRTWDYMFIFNEKTNKYIVLDENDIENCELFLDSKEKRPKNIQFAQYWNKLCYLVPIDFLELQEVSKADFIDTLKSA